MAAPCFSMTACFQRPQEEVSPVSSHIQNTSNKISTARRNMKPLTTSTVYPRRLFVKASSSSSDPVMVKKHNSFPSKAASPWLMLTPEMKPSSGVFKFYSLAEDKVITIERKNLKGQLGLESKKVDLVFKGSSHGWLVIFDRLSCDLFLYNPRTNRHLTLPTIRNLEAISEYDLESGDCVTKVIISSSNPATDPNCRALMIYGFDDHLAFCCPSGGSEWIETHHCSYDDVVHYGGNSMLFFGVNVEAYPEFHAWDLKDISRPKLISLEDRLVKDFGETFPWKGYDFRRLEEANFLVAHCGDEQQLLFYVGLDLKNMDFHVHKFDFENGKLVCMDRSLDGLALFIGRNHSFALSATDELPQLKANSIYFANPEQDEFEEGSHVPLGRIYNYEDGTFSPAPIYTVKDSSRHASPPMWFDII